MTDPPLPVLGEVHTGLVQHATALPPTQCAQVLALLPGERVRRHERPIAHAVSPETLTGVDCHLAGATGRVRGIGTVACRSSITGGRVLQCTATARLTRSRSGRRLPWSHYLARPGRIEVIGKVDGADLAAAFTGPRTSLDALDLSAITTRAVDAVQTSLRLDRQAPLRAPRTRLRWAVLVTDGASDGPRMLRFRVEDATLRTAVLSCDPDHVDSVQEFCTDLAMHDWLLTTVSREVERSRIGATTQPGPVRTLRPIVDHLLHLWMPAARGDDHVAALWAGLERRPGLSRQWLASVARIRDQLALTTIELLEAALDPAGRNARASEPLVER